MKCPNRKPLCQLDVAVLYEVQCKTGHCPVFKIDVGRNAMVVRQAPVLNLVISPEIEGC